MRSPLKDRPLRNPGESLDRRLSELVDDASVYIVISCFLVALALQEWWKYAHDLPHTPILHTLIALVAVLFSGWRIYPYVTRVKSMKQGRDGEKEVGHILELSGIDGSRIYHDVPADYFNLDHVLICKKGIFVIETKTYSKPDKGRVVITYDGKRIGIEGKYFTRDPIVQVESAARFLRQQLHSSTGRWFDIQPVVTFPGWYVKQRAPFTRLDVWVLNPKGISYFVDKEQDWLSTEEVALVSERLSNYIRNYEPPKKQG